MLISLEDELFLMVNLRSHSTGLPMNIWVSQRGNARHAARIKVQSDHRPKFDIDNLAIVGIDPPILIEGFLTSKDLDRIREWIALNRNAILDHWNELTDGIELGQALKPLI